jgi:hypothetical protein
VLLPIPICSFVVSLWRAAAISIAHDEALTVLRFVPLGIGEIFGRGPLDLHFANNHPLNTALIKLAVQTFGLHELAVRWPSLLGHALYLGCIVALVHRHVPRYPVIAVGLLTSHPLLIDFFSAGRGYGLGLGWLLVAVWCADRARTGRGRSRGWWNAAGAGAGVLMYLSNLAYLHAHMGIIATMLLVEVAHVAGPCAGGGSPSRRATRSLRDAVIPIALSAPPLWLVYGPYLGPGVAFRVFYVGGRRGFWPDTVASLVQGTFYGPPVPSWVLLLAQGMIVVSLPVAGGVLVGCLRGRLGQPERWPWWTVPMVALVSSGVTAALAPRLYRVLYITDRSALFFVPLYLLMLVGVWQSIAESARPAGRRLAATLACAFLLLTGWQMSRWQVRNYSLWAYDAHTREAVDVIRRDLAMRPLDRLIRVGAHWVFEPSLNFYRVKYALPMEPVKRAPAHNEYDYYYVFETFRWGGRTEHARQIQQAFDLEQLAHYADTGTYVFRR